MSLASLLRTAATTERLVDASGSFADRPKPARDPKRRDDQRRRPWRRLVWQWRGAWRLSRNASGLERRQFPHLADHIRSRLFLSHIRATTGSPVQNTNCHPFSYENWLFQHNGSVPQFGKLIRQLMFDVDPELFPSIGGSTDSETLFFLALTFGLRDDPSAALARTMGHVERAREAAGIQQPIQFSACTTDGSQLWAVRYSSNNQSRTQYHSRHIHALRDIHGTYEPLPDGAVILLSEPLDELSEHWEAVPESSLVVVEDGKTAVSSFSPR